jgi:hypothetical protein
MRHFLGMTRRIPRRAAAPCCLTWIQFGPVDWSGPRQSRVVVHGLPEGAAAPSAVISLAAAVMAVVAMSPAYFTSLSP